MMDMSLKQAIKSSLRYRVGAVITRNGRIISVGTNQANRYSKYIDNKFRKCNASLHAEADAIMKLLKEAKLDRLAGADIHVSRVRKNGSVGMAKPCKHCTALIEAVGIRRVYYTTDLQTTEMYHVR
jgi:deoxycytidylate deaminase